MSGSRLGRGRGGRLALYGGCGVVVVLLIFIYRAGTSQMAVLRELHEQCAHQQETLAAQLQVIFEYKVRLEKSLAEEKNSNAAVKQELQQRATREKSLRDKDSVEAMQRFNSLQQTYKMLQTEHRDLQEECKKRQKLALEESNKLESVLQELRSQLKKAHEDKERSLEHLKNKYLEIETEKTRLEDRYNELIRSNGNADSTVQHLHKEVFQLKRELDEVKRSCKATPLVPSTTSARSSQQVNRQSGALQEPVGSAAILAARQQNVPTTAGEMATPRKYEGSTRSGISLATASPDKINVVPAKLATKVKLPVGVPPIPQLIDSKIELEEKRKNEPQKKDEVAWNLKNGLGEVEIKDKTKIVDDNIVEAPPALPPVIGRHVGDQVPEKQENWQWPRVRLGVQEIGDEPNHLEKIPGFEDGAVRQAGDAGEYAEDYEGADYDKEPAQKNNDLHIEEGEDEGEDEDDQLEYDNNNLKSEKRE